MITIKIEGLAELSKKVNTVIRWKDLFKKRIGQEVTFFGEAIVGTSRERFLSGRPGLNVVTGRLRSSVNYRVKELSDGFAMTVGTNVSYAAVHEFGDVKGYIHPRPFLRPAVEAEHGKFVDNIRKILDEFAEQFIGE